ncbi:MAG: hypothetical protein GKR89_18135 [Candidatus Latescibacteria bacterium]|nr:hypothetical protein [Candidatus Latescibacterota bacterium]
MQYRTLGRTGERVSELGFGGTGVGMKNYLSDWDPEEQTEASIEAVSRAVELGVNYFDTAPLYGRGRSEHLFGRALKPHRDRVFLATKVRAASADEVVRSVDESLERLQTERIDLLQYHGEWINEDILEDILKPGGVLAGLQKAQQQGTVRYIGFTSEGVTGPVSRLVETDSFDVMQIQYNLFFQHPCDPDKQQGVMYEAEARSMGIVLMRTFTGGVFQKWIPQAAPQHHDQVDFHRALLGFALSNPMTDVALADMRRTDWLEANAAVSDDPSARIDLDGLFRRF